MIKSNGIEKKAESNEGFVRQGSLRRVLPSGHNKENLFGRQNEDLNKFYKTFHQEYVIIAEYNMILTENVRGVYVIPSRENPLVWFGVIFVRSGFYEDGIFRFTIYLDENFPDSKHPKVIFQSEIIHPVISQETKELNLLGGFPLWSKTEQHIWQILKYIHWVFHYVESSLMHAVNMPVLNLFRNNEEAFRDEVSRCVEMSRDRVYDVAPTDDKHYLTFERYTPNIHNSVKASMIHQIKEQRLVTPGLSWVKENTFRPLTREPSLQSETES